MRAKHLEYILGFLALVGRGHGTRIAPVAECTAQAWVRAPDLVPNTIVQGDARVKISAECPGIESISLGLRFKERSFMRALRSREDVKKLGLVWQIVSSNEDFPKAWPLHFVNQSLKEAHEELLSNKGLWFIREEERAVFEATQPFDIGIWNHGVLRDAVQDFSILIPSTNFPLGLEKFVGSMFRESEVLNVEWIYEYFAQISFSNGTTKYVSAGHTAFQPLRDPANAVQGPRSASAGLNPSPSTGGKPWKDTPTVNYSIEISADPGLTFIAGTQSHVVDAVVTRTGLARVFSAPLKISVNVMPELSPKWAVEYDVSDQVGLPLIRTSVLRTILDDASRAVSEKKRLLHSRRPEGVAIIMPNSTSDEMQANEIVTTTSTKFRIPIELDDRHLTNFETYYQTLSNSLSITLEIPWVENEEVDPDDPLGEHDVYFDRGQPFEDDEMLWIPWEPRKRPAVRKFYSGRIPIVVHPPVEVTPQHCVPASRATSGQVVLPNERNCEQSLPLTHYLAKGARGPTFVGHSSVHALLAEDPTERDLHAPILKPIVSSPPEGEELIYRYYSTNIDPRKKSIYVGETWAKRVVNKDLLVSSANGAGASDPAI